jgi:hypothetical protein
MPLSVLAKSKSQLTPKTWTTDLGMWLTPTWEHNWWSWMKPFVEFPRSKKSLNFLKTVLDGPLFDKWNMWKMLISKKSMENSKSKSCWMCYRESKERNSMFGRCKTSNRLIVFENTKVGAKGARALLTHVNSLACPKANLHPSQCRGCQRGRIKIKQSFWHARD